MLFITIVSLNIAAVPIFDKRDHHRSMPGQENRIGGFTPLSFQCDNVEKTYEEMGSK